MVEGFSSTFQDVCGEFLHVCSVDRAGSAELGPAFFLAEHADPFSVAEHRNIRVVRREEELPLRLARPQFIHDVVSDEGVVEVVLRLVDDERVKIVKQ